MELKLVFSHIKANIRLFWTTVICVLVICLGIYFLPSKYYSSGTFFVGRQTDVNTTFFAYEGYYAQQTALNYTNSAVALMESIDIESTALKSLGIPINEVTLRRYANHISVRKSGPQIVTLTVKGNTFENAKALWNAISQNSLQTFTELNKNTDNKISLTQVLSEPVVKAAYKNVYLNGLIGLIGGLALAIIIVITKEYFKEDTK